MGVDLEKTIRLCKAVAGDDLAGARAALADGADVNARVPGGAIEEGGPLASPARPPLSWASSAAMAALLLDAGAEIDATDDSGYTALRRAVLGARWRGMGIVELLLQRGARPSMPLEEGWRGGGVGLVRRLLEAGAKITPAARNYMHHDADARTLLEEWPIRSSTASDRDRQLLLAARAGTLDAVKALLGEGADPLARDADGASTIDHAMKRGHTGVAIALERAAAARHPQAELFVAILDDLYGATSSVAGRADLQARTDTGKTALVLAARYRRHAATQALVAAGAGIDQSVLVAAIEADDLPGMLWLLDHGGGSQVDITLLRAACGQSDSDLVKHLLVRGFDVAPYPDLYSANEESQRLIRDARAGRRPPPIRPTAFAWGECPLCRDLPDKMGWCNSASGDSTGEPLPAATEQFEIVGWSRRGMRKCPHCGTYYDYEFDHDNGIPDGWDSEELIRMTDAKALAGLRALASEPRIEREIAALTAKIEFDEALASPGRKAIVADPDVKDGRRALIVYRLGDDGARLLASRQVPDGEVDARVAAFVARGLEVAITEEYCDIVWVHAADRIQVFDDRHAVLDVAGDRATTLLDGRVVPRCEVARVVAYATDDCVHRGIKAVLRSGEEVELVSEVSLAAIANEMGFPVYSRNELIVETVWCSTLGVAIARWADVAFEDRV